MRGFYEPGAVAVAAAYLLLAWATWRTLDAPQRTARWRAAVLPLLAVAHAALLGAAIWSGGEFRFGFAQALSATLLLAVLVLWVEGMFVTVRGLDILVLPAAAVCVLLPLGFHGAAVGADSTALRLHLLVAMAAYSLLTIAALHALLMAVLDRRLHSPLQAPASGIGRIFGQLPPLLALEKLLFQLIGAGFLLLTATLVTGVLFSEQLFGRALRFEHKTVFTIASWLVFASLIGGRIVFGWRGRTALRWTFAGFLMLLLAYVGSRFVLEVVLGRV
ncbi:MAG: cytochrome c biogenesis protein CcsA [Burkholderiales bacterium]|jgi:ABC-type uncharacterized transport system permease subunit|nr:cytochrome c biogenesis protein CcsA [Burkholderiales bacterium]